MLKGKDFGAAIGSAIQMKLDLGVVRSKAEIARHFKVTPPSVEDWINKGSIQKDRLPELWRFFSDVAGPEHWGMTPAEWPAGLTGGHPLSSPAQTSPPLTNEESSLLSAYRQLGSKERQYLITDAQKYLDIKK